MTPNALISLLQRHRQEHTAPLTRVPNWDLSHVPADVRAYTALARAVLMQATIDAAKPLDQVRQTQRESKDWYLLMADRDAAIQFLTSDEEEWKDSRAFWFALAFPPDVPRAAAFPQLRPKQREDD